MARDAVCLRFTIPATGSVAIFAVDFEVRADEIEIGEGMIEIFFDKLHDIGFATLVIGVAGRALSSAGFGMKTVITGRRLYVRGDVLVTIHAELPLGRFVEH